MATCVWDHGGGRGPLSLFWHAAQELDPSARRDADASPGSTAGDLVRLMGAGRAGRRRGGELSVTIRLASFEDWWAPFEEPAGSVGRLPRDPHARPDRRAPRALPGRAPDGPFDLTVWTWTATGHSELHPTLTRPFSTGGSGKS